MQIFTFIVKFGLRTSVFLLILLVQARTNRWRLPIWMNWNTQITFSRNRWECINGPFYGRRVTDPCKMGLKNAFTWINITVISLFFSPNDFLKFLINFIQLSITFTCKFSELKCSEKCCMLCAWYTLCAAVLNMQRTITNCTARPKYWRIKRFLHKNLVYRLCKNFYTTIVNN